MYESGFIYFWRWGKIKWQVIDLRIQASISRLQRKRHDHFCLVFMRNYFGSIWKGSRFLALCAYITVWYRQKIGENSLVKTTNSTIHHIKVTSIDFSGPIYRKKNISHPATLQLSQKQTRTREKVRAPTFSLTKTVSNNVYFGIIQTKESE